MIDVVFHPAVLDHDTGAGVFEGGPSDLLDVPELHPENAERVRNMVSVLRRGPLADHLRWHGVLDHDFVRRPLVVDARRRDRLTPGRQQRHSIHEYSNNAPDSQETNLFRRFAELVLSGQPDPTWGEIALKTQKVVDACLTSSRQDGKLVPV